jgi:hypothetical protein
MYAYIQHGDVKENPFRNSRAIAKVILQNKTVSQTKTKYYKVKTRG